MPTTGTSTKKISTPKAASTGKKKPTAAKKAATNGSNDFPDFELSKAELAKRKKSQIAVIKRTDKKILHDMLYQMVLGRIFEEKCAEVYRMGKIGGFCHLYIGQEAIGIGTLMALRPEDNVITSYRDHVQAGVKGITPEAGMAELDGREGGCVKVKGGSMHIFSKGWNFFGGHGMVGGQIGVGTGIAFASKYKGNDNVTLCFFGEAAVNQGIFHESLNMAQLWKLPIIFICENNKYGMGTSQSRAMSVKSVASKGDAYGVANEFVDGMDVMEVREATERAVKRAREESLPTLLEIRAYRYMGHSMSDPGNYRTRDEILKYQERDPIHLFQGSLKEAKVFTDKDFDKIREQAMEATQKALDFAEASPLPDPSELLTDVLV